MNGDERRGEPFESPRASRPQAATARDAAPSVQTVAPTISLPKDGGAIRGIGEKFGANAVTGRGSMTLPIFASPGRSGFGPQLALSSRHAPSSRKSIMPETLPSNASIN